jgi:hypothetical protein
MAQALLAEAIEREAAKVAATEGTPSSAQTQGDPTSVVGGPSLAPQVEIRGEESKVVGTSVAPLGSTKRKRKTSNPSMSVRPNLRPTPARQAWASQAKAQ